MCQFVDAIQYTDGEFKRLAYHQKRAEYALKEHYPTSPIFSIFDYLRQIDLPKHGTYKIRLLYSNYIVSYECIPYQMKEIITLKLAQTTTISLYYKKADRKDYKIANADKSNNTEILFVKNNLITDTSYANVALLQNGIWYTPRTPLIFGVNRASLLDQGLIKEKDIAVKEINRYEKIAIFNAMIEFGSCILPTDCIFR